MTVCLLFLERKIGSKEIVNNIKGFPEPLRGNDQTDVRGTDKSKRKQGRGEMGVGGVGGVGEKWA